MVRRSTLPLTGLDLALVGPGRVGGSLAAWAVARGAVLHEVAGRHPEPAIRLAARLGGRRVALEELASAGRGLLLIAVTDGAVETVARTLAARPQGAVTLHTSGSLGASALAPLREAGCAVGSLHPLKAFPRQLPDPAEAAGTFFAVDGDPAARALGERLAAAFGGVAAIVPEEARDLYHLAASVAAGGVATLVASAGELARTQELPDAVLRGYLELARGALAALERDLDTPRPERAITGPLARGDTATFLRELAALRDAGPPADRRLALLARLALETVRLTAGDAAAGGLGRALQDGGFLDRPGDGC